MELCAFYDLATGYFHAPRLRVAILPAEWGKGGVGMVERGFVGGGCVMCFSCACGLIQSPQPTSKSMAGTREKKWHHE